MVRSRIYLAALLLSCWFLPATAPRAQGAEKVDFQRQIRPLLADRCFACHGRDEEHREGKLRLDERDAA